MTWELAMELDIPGKPTAWAAPTVTRRGVSFKKKHLVSYHPLVGPLAAAEWDGEPHHGPVKLDILITRLKPKSWPRWKCEPVTKPDLDNVCKSISDALEGICYRGDQQVTWLGARKVLGDREYVTVRVWTQEWER